MVEMQMEESPREESPLGIQNQLNPDSFYDFLIWIDNIIDVVEISTTTSYNIPIDIVRRIIKLRLHSKHGRVLNFIAKHGAFTIYSAQKQLGLHKMDVQPIVKFLENAGLVIKKSEVKGSRAPPTNIYLVRGADEKKVFEAMELHNDLKPTGAPLPFDYFKYKDEAEEIVNQILQFYKERKPHKKIYGSTINWYVKDENGKRDIKLYKAVEKRLGEVGWIVLDQ